MGTPHDIYDDPADTFVATFVGSPPMNLVERDDVLVGFRPEQLLPRASVDLQGADAVTVKFAVHRVEELGSERHFVGTVAGLGADTGSSPCCRSTVSVAVPPARRRSS